MLCIFLISIFQLFYRFAALDGPAAKRKEAIREQLKYFEFGFEVETELQWIKDHEPLVMSEVLGSNLHEAQTSHKKHKKLEAELHGHQPMIDKTITNGETLISQKHSMSDQVRKVKIRESPCLAGEPKHFPFAIVFVLIIKITLTCTKGFP